MKKIKILLMGIAMHMPVFAGPKEFHWFVEQIFLALNQKYVRNGFLGDVNKQVVFDKQSVNKIFQFLQKHLADNQEKFENELEENYYQKLQDEFKLEMEKIEKKFLPLFDNIEIPQNGRLTAQFLNHLRNQPNKITADEHIQKHSLLDPNRFANDTSSLIEELSRARYNYFFSHLDRWKTADLNQFGINTKQSEQVFEGAEEIAIYEQFESSEEFKKARHVGKSASSLYELYPVLLGILKNLTSLNLDDEQSKLNNKIVLTNTMQYMAGLISGIKPNVITDAELCCE